MLGLLSEADTAELKLTVPEEHGQRLPVDRHSARHRPDGRIHPPGLLLRHSGPRPRCVRASWSAPAALRASPTTRWSSCARSFLPSFPTDLRARKSFGVEVDALPGGFVCSGSFKGGSSRTTLRPAIAGEGPLSQALLQAPARLLRRACAGGDRVRRPRDPRPRARAQAQVHAARATTGRLVVELWFYPDGSRILELSTQVRARRGLRRRRRDAGVPRRARRRPLRRAADEDAHRARVLRRTRCGR